MEAIWWPGARAKDSIFARADPAKPRLLPPRFAGRETRSAGRDDLRKPLTQFRGKPSPGKPGRNDTLRKKEECGKPFRGKPFRGKPFLRGKPFRGTPFRGTPGRTGHPEGKVTCSEGM